MISNKHLGLLTGLIVFLIIILLPSPSGMSPSAKNAAAVALLMAIWWISDAIPIFATALVPMVFFPILKIMPAGETAINYGHDFVLMTISGFFLAKAIEAQNLHTRIALVLINALGSSRPRILLSIMIATTFLSMWIANVTTALLMLPIGMAIILKEESMGNSNPKFGTALMLGIAYSASIGGLGTIIGSPTNMIFTGIMAKLYPEAPPIGFFTWMKVGVPLILIFLPLVWYYIIKFFKIRGDIPGNKEMIKKEMLKLGKMSKGEKRVLVVFIFTTIGWIFREDFVIDKLVIPGWASFIGVSEYAKDSTVGMLAALFLFSLSEGNKKRILDWKTAVQIPWGVGIIIGGGYAMAQSFKITGLADWIGSQLSFFSDYPTIIVLIVVIAFVLLFTELNPNTASVNIFLPVLGAMAVAGNINPLLLMVPATFASSMAFIMPAGTGPNTVIFGSNRVTAGDMARCGLGIKIISLVLLIFLAYFLIIPLMGIERAMPLWAY